MEQGEQAEQAKRSGTKGKPGQTIGLLLVRRLLPAAVLVPLGLGAVVLWGQREARLNLPDTMALYALGTMGVFALLISITARRLNQIDAERREAEAAREQSEAFYLTLV
jgi:hypothetical protein